MSQTDYKPILDAAIAACDCHTPRCLIERIVETYKLPKRSVITPMMDTIIVRDTLAGQTAKQIATTLCISAPTVSAARRRLGLTHDKRNLTKKTLTIAPSLPIISGVEDRTATERPNP